MFQVHHGSSREGGHDANVTTFESRRASQAGVRFGRCEVRPASREVLVDGRHRQLQPRPFDLLVYLIDHRERVLSIDELLDAIWGHRIVQPSSLTVAINRIRRVLADQGGHIIRTHHRVGYRFVAELQSAERPVALPLLEAHS